jgi:hypothetical protein
MSQYDGTDALPRMLKNLTLFLGRSILQSMNARWLTVLGLCLAAGLAWGADGKKTPPPQKPAALADDVFFAYGTVAKVEAGKLTMSEYDYENDEELNVAYEMDPAVVFKNVDSLKNICPGTTVEVNFIVKNNKRVATQVAVEDEAGADEGDSTGEQYEEDKLLEEEE